VLAIFDCCYPSKATKGFSEDRRLYEVIAASSKDYVRPAPGDDSFTSHLIASLRELLEEHKDNCFTTSKLVATINTKHEKSREAQFTMLHNRLENYFNQHIALARIDEKVAELKQEIHDHRPVAAAHLDLRFSLQDPELNQKQIEKLPAKLRNAFEKSNIQLCRIDWRNISQSRIRYTSDSILLTQKPLEVARMDNRVAKYKQELIDEQPAGAAHLDLRFLLHGPELNQKKAEILPARLRAAFEGADIQLCRIDWIELAEIPT
jgi:hypothetical protein